MNLSMIYFEYMEIKPASGNLSVDQLNAFGINRWELVLYLSGVYTFKRLRDLGEEK